MYELHKRKLSEHLLGIKFIYFHFPRRNLIAALSNFDGNVTLLLALVVELLDKGVVTFFELLEQPQLLEEHQHSEVSATLVSIQGSFRQFTTYVQYSQFPIFPK